MNTLKDITSLIRMIAAVIPVKGWLILFGLIVGISTSYYGLVWTETKFAKQEADCISNIYYDFADTKTANSQQLLLNSLDKIEAKQNDCRKAISSDKGAVEFLKEQRDRQKQGRP